MLSFLKLHHIGPSRELEARFAPRLNLITGDNGLGKSFLLDVAWWAMTHYWPVELNRKLGSGLMARPALPNDPAEIRCETIRATDVATSEAKHLTARTEVFHALWSADGQIWLDQDRLPVLGNIVLYAMADGSFALWDPARNAARATRDFVKGYAFSAREVWDGLIDPERGLLCNGLIADWGSWQKENGAAFAQLRAVLEKLSVAGEPLEPGPFTRISLDDPRDIPTLKMAYGQNTPILHASSGIKRIISFAYLLVWAWQEHVKASELRGKPASPHLTFLIDEVEAHLHPRWQRQILDALLNVASALATEAQVQMIITTHAPLVMAAAEPRFDSERDAWFDFDLEQQQVLFRQREFEKHGVVANWLGSEAFDLPSDRAIEYETLITQAQQLLEQEPPPKPKQYAR